MCCGPRNRVGRKYSSSTLHIYIACTLGSAVTNTVFAANYHRPGAIPPWGSLHASLILTLIMGFVSKHEVGL